MPTQIIDGFRLNAATPIDTRIVAANAAQRNNITYKYEGLRVFDLTDKTGYVWLDGQWKEEGTTSITNITTGGGGGGGSLGGSISGKLNTISKFDTKGLTNSIITESTKNNQYFVGIGVQQTTHRLEVNGSFKATTITGQIDGSNVVVDTLGLDRLKKPTAAGNYVIKYNGTSTVWALESTSAASVGVTNQTVPATLHYLVFSAESQATSANLLANYHSATKAIAVKPDTSQLLMTSQSVPSYSFIGQPTTGMFGDSSEIGLKLSDRKILSAVAGETKINVVSTTNPSTTIESIKIAPTTVSLAQKLVVRNYVTVDYDSASDYSQISLITKPLTTSLTGNDSGAKVRRSGFVKFNYANVVTTSPLGASTLTTTSYLHLGIAAENGTQTNFLSMIADGTNKIVIRPNLNGSTVAAGSILQSVDTSGTLTWATLETGVPYGFIMMFPYDSAVPAGWKEVNGSGYIYIGGQYRAMPDYRDRMVFGLPNNGNLGSDYGNLSPTVQSVTVKLETGNIPAHQHVFGVPKHKHYMKNSTTDGESANVSIASSGGHSHVIRTHYQSGVGTGISTTNSSADPKDSNADRVSGGSHTHGKESFDGYTSYKIYDNSGNEGIGSLGTTYPTSYSAITQRLNYNVDGGTTQPITIGQRRAITTRFMMKYNPSATTNQEGHWSLYQTGTSPAGPVSPNTPDPWGGGFPAGPSGASTGGVFGGLVGLSPV